MHKLPKTKPFPQHYSENPTCEKISSMTSAASAVEKELDEKKSLLGELFEKGLSKAYYDARNSVFPTAVSGSKGYDNRAGKKLDEIVQEFDLLPGNPSELTFFDVAGGPGAFSTYFLSKKLKKGYGVTLLQKGSLAWYEKLKSDKKFTILWGADKTGDIMSSANQDSLSEGVGKVDIVVADGGIGDDDNQELASARLILCEIGLAMRCLVEGGSFVCKIFETRSNFMKTLLLITSSVFSETTIYKPPTSRAVNSERYLVCKGYEPLNEALSFIQSTITGLENENELGGPFLYTKLVEKMQTSFTTAISAANESLASDQLEALSLVIDSMDYFQYDPAEVQKVVDYRPDEDSDEVFLKINPLTGQVIGRVEESVNQHTLHFLIEQEILMYPFKRYHMEDTVRIFAKLLKHRATLQVTKDLPPTSMKFSGDVSLLYYKHAGETGILLIGNKESAHRDYEIDKIGDFFTEPVRIRAKVKKSEDSPWEYWLKEGASVISALQKEGKATPYEIREALNRKTHEATQFKPTLARFVYRHFSSILGRNIVVLDFCSGWGCRLIGGMGSGVVTSYTGIDPNKLLVDGYNEIISTKKREFGVKMIVGCAEDMKFSSEFDVVFTSCPYFDYEIYDSSSSSQSVSKYPKYKEWRDKFLFASLDKSIIALKKGGFLAIHLSDFSNERTCEQMLEHMRKNKACSFEGCMMACARSNIPIFVWRKL